MSSNNRMTPVSLKAAVVDENMRLVGEAAYGYSPFFPQPGWAEQDPELWWSNLILATNDVLQSAEIDPSSVSAIGVAYQMHGLVLLDEAGEVLRPALLWNDGRTGAECDEIRERVGKERLIQITGNDALTGFTAPKILWVRNHEPDLFAQVRHILLKPDALHSDEENRIRIEQLSQRIRGGGDFATLARSNSQDTLSAARGGDLGWVSPGELVPQFEEAMDALLPGEVSDPVKTEFGWHLIQVTDRRDYDSTEEFKRFLTTHRARRLLNSTHRIFEGAYYAKDGRKVPVLMYGLNRKSRPSCRP